MRFANDFHSWLRHSQKLLANRLICDPKIAIHGNSWIILYITVTFLCQCLFSFEALGFHDVSCNSGRVIKGYFCFSIKINPSALVHLRMNPFLWLKIRHYHVDSSEMEYIYFITCFTIFTGIFCPYRVYVRRSVIVTESPQNCIVLV